MEGKEKQVASTREREQIFKAKHPKGGEKERREQKLLGHNFFLFLFSFLFFFSVLERVAKHDFYGIVLQSGSVKSSQSGQVRQEEEQGEQGRAERERQEGEGGRGCLYVCACFCVLVSECVCTSSIWEGRKICCLCVCVCVYVQRGPSPHPPSKRRLLRTKLFIDSFLFFNVYSYFLVFCVLPSFLFFCFTFHL